LTYTVYIHVGQRRPSHYDLDPVSNRPY